MNTRTIKTAAIGGLCALVGAAGGIAGAGAHHGPGEGKGERAARPAGPPVHADLVVPDRQGAFHDVTLDRGTVDSVSGDQLTIKEGTAKATYKTLTLTIPAAAKVKRDRQDAALSDLQAGDLVAVVQTDGVTVVKAFSKGAAKASGRGHGRAHGRVRHTH